MRRSYRRWSVPAGVRPPARRAGSQPTAVSGRHPRRDGSHPAGLSGRSGRDVNEIQYHCQLATAPFPPKSTLSERGRPRPRRDGTRATRPDRPAPSRGPPVWLARAYRQIWWKRRPKARLRSAGRTLRQQCGRPRGRLRRPPRPASLPRSGPAAGGRAKAPRWNGRCPGRSSCP